MYMHIYIYIYIYTYTYSSLLYYIIFRRVAEHAARGGLRRQRGDRTTALIILRCLGGGNPNTNTYENILPYLFVVSMPGHMFNQFARPQSYGLRYNGGGLYIIVICIVYSTCMYIYIYIYICVVLVISSSII